MSNYIIISQAQYDAWQGKKVGVNKFNAIKTTAGSFAVDALAKNEFPSAFIGSELVKDLTVADFPILKK
jgi:hypothetical protein